MCGPAWSGIHHAAEAPLKPLILPPAPLFGLGLQAQATHHAWLKAMLWTGNVTQLIPCYQASQSQPHRNWAWWHKPAIPALHRWRRQGNQWFKVIVCYILSSRTAPTSNPENNFILKKIENRTERTWSYQLLQEDFVVHWHLVWICWMSKSFLDKRQWHEVRF